MTDGRYISRRAMERLAQAFTTNQTFTNDSTRVGLFDCTSGNLTCTLPSASAAVGTMFYIQKTDSSLNTLQIVGTVDGATHTISEQYGSRMLYSDGTTWHALGGREFYFDAANDRFAFGHRDTSFTISGAVSASRLSVDTDTSTTTLGFVMDRHSSILPSWIWGLRTRGTESAPTIVSSGDLIFQLQAAAWDGTDYEPCGYISFEIDGTPGNNDMPGRIIFYTTPDGSNVGSEAWRMDSSQRSGNVAGTLTSYLDLKASTSSISQARLRPGTQPSSPQDGDLWHDSGQKGICASLAGVGQTLVGTVFTQTATGTIGNSTTETAIDSTGAGTKTLPANFFVAGKTARFSAKGYFSSDGATPTIRLRLKFGSITVIDFSAAVATAAMGAAVWTAEGFLTCRTTGVTGTVFGQGDLRYGDTAAGTAYLAGTGASSPVTIDTTASQAVSLTAQWSAAAAANSISCTNFTIEVLN